MISKKYDKNGYSKLGCVDEIEVNYLCQINHRYTYSFFIGVYKGVLCSATVAVVNCNDFR